MRRYPIINIQRAVLSGFTLFWLAVSWWRLCTVDQVAAGDEEEELQINQNHSPQAERVFKTNSSKLHHLDIFCDALLLFGSFCGLLGVLSGTRLFYLSGLSLFTVCLLFSVPANLVIHGFVLVYEMFVTDLRIVTGSEVSGPGHLQDGLASSGAHRGAAGTTTTGEAIMGRTSVSNESDHAAGATQQHGTDLLPAVPAGAAAFGPSSTPRDVFEPNELTVVLHYLTCVLTAVKHALNSTDFLCLVSDVIRFSLAIVNLMFLRGCFAVLTEYIFDDDLPENVNLLWFRWDAVTASDILPVRKGSRHDDRMSFGAGGGGPFGGLGDPLLDSFATPLSLTPRAGFGTNPGGGNGTTALNGVSNGRQAALLGTADHLFHTPTGASTSGVASQPIQVISPKSVAHTDLGISENLPLFDEAMVVDNPPFVLSRANSGLQASPSSVNTTLSRTGSQQVQKSLAQSPTEFREALKESPNFALLTRSSTTSSNGGSEANANGNSNANNLSNDLEIADMSTMTTTNVKKSTGILEGTMVTPMKLQGASNSGFSSNAAQHNLQLTKTTSTTSTSQQAQLVHPSHHPKNMQIFPNVHLQQTDEQLNLSWRERSALSEFQRILFKEDRDRLFEHLKDHKFAYYRLNSELTKELEQSQKWQDSELWRGLGRSGVAATSTSNNAAPTTSSSTISGQASRGTRSREQQSGSSAGVVSSTFQSVGTTASRSSAAMTAAVVSGVEIEHQNRIDNIIERNNNNRASSTINATSRPQSKESETYPPEETHSSNRRGEMNRTTLAGADNTDDVDDSFSHGGDPNVLTPRNNASKSLSSPSRTNQAAGGPASNNIAPQLQHQQQDPPTSSAATSSSSCTTSSTFFLTQRSMLRFLYSSKMNPAEAKKLLDVHVKMIQKMNLKAVSDEDVRKNYSRGFCVLSGRDFEGRPMIWIKYKFINPNEIKIPVGIKSTWLSIDAALQDVPSMAKGVRLVYDFNGLRLQNVASARPWEFKDAISAVAFCHPSVIASVVFLDAPPLLRHAWQIAQAMVPKKLKRVVQFVTTHNVPDWYAEFCEVSQLPRYLGGQQVPNADFHSYLLHRVKNDSLLY
ncbi:unnamed protein product [Amoebophrya sp. A120]|nr:unnamed protein product [Amoebophrya sp. A120]|eukprot:GSA120T00014843001.1